MQNLVEFTHFEKFIFIQQWLTQNMWSIGVTICIFNNNLENISFKNSFIWKNEKGLKRTHNPFVKKSHWLLTSFHFVHCFNPIDSIGVTFAIWWHLIGSVKIPISPMLVHYPKCMCGVDVQDQPCGYYILQRRDHKWWHWSMFHIIDTTIVNSYIMYKVHMVWLGKSL